MGSICLVVELDEVRICVCVFFIVFNSRVTLERRVRAGVRLGFVGL